MRCPASSAAKIDAARSIEEPPFEHGCCPVSVPIRKRKHMPQPERFEILVLGSGQGGKLLAWHMAQSGRRTAVVERQWIGGSCPNIACLPSKNEIWSAKGAHLVHHAAQFC